MNVLNNTKDYAPVIIFAYNRPQKLMNLLRSLKNNEELMDSDLIFFIDRKTLNGQLL